MKTACSLPCLRDAACLRFEYIQNELCQVQKAAASMVLSLHNTETATIRVEPVMARNLCFAVASNGISTYFKSQKFLFSVVIIIIRDLH